MWTRLQQQQQRGAQMEPRRAAGEAPAEAVADRSAQGHAYADLDTGDGTPRSDIDYPATNPPERKGDITPTAADEGDPDWDAVVQPERAPRDDQGA